MHEGLLLQAVRASWLAKENRARIDDVVDFLKNASDSEQYAESPTIRSRLDEMIVLLDQYTANGTYGQYFNSDEPSLRDDAKMVVLELGGLEDRPSLLVAVMFSLIIYIENRMYRTPRNLKKLNVIDEGWRLLDFKNHKVGEFIEKGYRTARRHTGAYITITQNIVDFDSDKASSAARAAWGNSSYKIILKQSAKEFAKYNQLYGNMQTENVNGFSWSTNSTTSFGQMMYQTGSGATATQTRDGNMVMDASGAMSRLPVGINATRQIAAAQQEMAREASNRAESALHGFSSSIASAWNTLSQFGSNRGSSDSVTGGADSTMSAQDSMMASRMRSAVESYAKAHNISNEQATQELASRSTRASAGMYGDAHAEWGVKPKILGVGGGLGVKGGGRAGIDWEDNDAHTASSNTQSSHNARHDIDARATQDFKEASDYFTSRKVSESGSHTDNNADSRVDQLSAALNSAKQSYDQFTTNMTRSHEYAEMASRTESMSGQMSEDLSQQFAQYVMKHAPQDAEAILTNTSSPEIAERRRAMAWSFVQEQVQPGVDNAWRESRGDIGKGMESVPSGGGSQVIIADHQGHQAIIEQRTQDSNIRNDVKHQVDNMVTEYKGNIGDTQNSIRGEENIVRGQYSELQNHHKTEALSQNNKYNEEKSAQERMPGADSPQELMKRAKEYQDKYKQ